MSLYTPRHRKGQPVEQAPGPGPVVVVIIPAHNEQATVTSTIRSVQAQASAPDRIIVISDNSTDTTVAVARDAGAETWESHRNTHMKAGALNQALNRIMPVMGDNDLILIVDADTEISGNFISSALSRFAADRDIGGLSGVYNGRPSGTWAGWAQRNEYRRWGFDARQQNGKAICLSGAASVFRVRALRDVRQARIDGRIHGTAGDIYDTGNFTEDFELSQGLLHAGWKIRNMTGVTITTSVKPTWGELYTQRRRWNRGITETLLSFGLTRHTRGMWLRWAVYTASVIAIPLSFFLIGERLTSGNGFPLNAWMWFWLSATALIAAHKSVTVASAGLRTAAIAVLLVAEIPYDLFLHAVYLRSLWDVITRAKKNWR